ncbi:carbohydrate kinase [Daedalea quercina L-15889]|uniref:gluconokinase n=1 Tax=Daedalea quercina L-15889 TaxID=1314783 RepID=A0A165SCA8_9APHY|nr:carbohydrate kinase [Daedalea quercina L-15889]
MPPDSTSVLVGHDKPVLIVVMGVAATGKTTLAKALCEKLQLPYIEGDELHPKANIEKMSNGQPLTDADREPWLALLRTTAEHIVAEEQQKGKPQLHEAKGVYVPSSTKHDAPPDAPRQRMGAIMTCSALRKYYREILRGKVRPNLPEPMHELEPPPPEQLPTYFVFMKGERDMLLDRISKRQGHYMKSNMVDSQLATLESPEGEEGVISVTIEQSTEEQVKIVLDDLNKLTGGL